MYKLFQELSISNVSIFLIDCQSYTFPLMNRINSDRMLHNNILPPIQEKNFHHKILANFQIKSPHCNERGRAGGRGG